MSIAPVSSESVFPEHIATKSNSEVVPACFDADLPLHSTDEYENQQSNESCSDVDNIKQPAVKEIETDSANDRNVGQNISTDTHDGIFKAERIESVSPSHGSNLYVAVSNVTSNDASETSSICSNSNDTKDETLEGEDKLPLHQNEDTEKHSPIIHVQEKYNCSNGPISSNDSNTANDNILNIKSCNKSPDSNDINSENIHILLIPPGDKQTLSYSEPGTTNVGKSYEGKVSDTEGCRIVNLEDYEEDDGFPSPPRPESPQSQLRDLCKRGDPVQLEKFLQEMCVEEIEKQVDKDSEGSNPTAATRTVDKSKVDLDASTEDGWTALHDIITHECQFTDVARVLLDFGANVNTQDIHGDSPLHSSLLYHNTDNIGLLLKYSADVDSTNASGRKPIHIANDGESLELLLDYGASVNSQDRIGNTPLHYAVVAKDVERVKLLLKRGCDVDISNRTGASPLHLPTDIDIASRLLNAAANPNAPDQHGNTALHVAVKGRHKEWAKLLVSWKADPHLANKNGKTPFNLAKDKEMKNILLGKTVDILGATNTGEAVTNIKKPKTTKLSAIATTGTTTECHSPLPYPPTSVVSSPSILKRRLDDSISASSGEKPRGPRLRFSDVNDYSGVEEVLPAKRVKVRPIYLEPQFSSDED